MSVMWILVATTAGALCACVHAAIYQEALPADHHEILNSTGGTDIHGTSLAIRSSSSNGSLQERLMAKELEQRTRATSGLFTNSETVQKDIIDIHNELRRRTPSTSTLEMSWDTDVARIAQAWADRCEFRHPMNSDDVERKTYLTTAKFSCGQNIAMGTGAMSWRQVIENLWYDEVKDFKFGVDTRPKVVGHYTQVVWRSTYKVGCGYKMCNAGTTKAFNFFVCDYAPAGNQGPDYFKPYESGNACAKCPNNCKNKLCTNPCPVSNALSNCEVSSGSYPALFPKGCSGSTIPESYKQKCAATCQCKGKLLY